MYEGQTIKLKSLDEGFVELCFDRQKEAINKLDKRTVAELRQAVDLIAATAGVRGVLVTSAKDVFIVGADITEFGAMFKRSEPEIAADVRGSNEVFVALEDLPVPTVAAINGYALGGGLECVLSCALRVMSDRAQIGVPEVKLGLFPGFGGTVRLPRVAGLSAAIDWIATGKPQTAAAALASGAVDEVCAHEALRETALAVLRHAEASEDWRARQQAKRVAVAGSAAERDALFANARPKVIAQSGKHQPAALIAFDLMEKAASLDRAGALFEESLAFARVARTQAAASLVQAFLSEQQLKKIAKQRGGGALPVKEAAVLGAGIMGGGIALTSARSGVPVRVKDLSPKALDAASAEASRQLARQVKAGRMKSERSDAILHTITTQTDEAGFEAVDIVVEAIVEKIEVKHQVLTSLEGKVRPDAIIASNTSSLRIADIAGPLARPHNFVGMHFFNPVPVMQLVEVVQGPASSEAAVATAVAYAAAMGKTPVVVKDCPGFLVNRVLMAYTGAALRLIADGADFVQVDDAMEAFGWPMGPSYLQDVIGIDTGSHVCDVIAAGYPQRMPPIQGDALKLMVSHGRLGQKSGLGFYRYEREANGRLVKSVASDTHALLATLQPHGPLRLTDSEIVDRLMLPFIVEAANALEEEVVGTPAELDMALLLAVGCPAYLGGALKYADWLGLDEVVRRCDALRVHGPMYEPTARMRRMAADRSIFYT